MMLAGGARVHPVERLAKTPIFRQSCAMQLPDGVEAEIPPPVEKRIAIAGKFLDETKIQMAGTPGTMLLSFPVQQHRGAVHDNGTVAVHTKMPTAVALFAEGVLPPVGGASVALTVQGKKLESMVLSEVRCGGSGGHNDIATLIFKPAFPSAAA